MKNKIGWCNTTWNPVWGCRNECPYCYARAMAKRFGAIRFIEEWHYRTEHYMDAIRFKLKNSLDLIDFKPTFLYSQIGKKLPKKPQRIFVGSMSEIYYWEKFWVEGVIKRIKLYPQHTFMFLTQNPEVYAQHIFATNCWYGVTMTKNKPIDRAFCVPTKKGLKFLSIEPLLEKIDIGNINDFEPDWIIMGAETGNRKGKVIPRIEWIDTIVDYCRGVGIPIYLKDSLNSIFPYEIKKFPKGVK